MWNISDCEKVKEFKKPNDICEKIICLDKKSIVLFVGKYYLNIFDYSILKNIKKIKLNSSPKFFFSQMNFLIQSDLHSFHFFDFMKNKLKYAVKTGQINLNKVCVDPSQNFNFLTCMISMSSSPIYLI